MKHFVLLVFLLALLASCITGGIHLYTCDDPCGNGEPGYTCDDPCSDAERCPGECLPVQPLGWDGPTQLWIGLEVNAPECPNHASQVAYEGHGDLDDSNQCSCTCGPATCALSGLTTNSTACPGDAPGTTHVTVDAPPGWDGSCVATPTVPGADLSSITFAPLSLNPCVPAKDPIPTPSLSSPWKRFARACRANEPFTACKDPTKYCAPGLAAPPDGFQQCILSLREGDQACPADYPEKHVFYSGFTDSRACTDCECGPPVGGVCTATVTAYGEIGCTALAVADNAAMPGPTCDNAFPGVGMKSMDAAFITSEPGSCAPGGGQPIGHAIPFNRSIFCCRTP